MPNLERDQQQKGREEIRRQDGMKNWETQRLAYWRRESAVPRMRLPPGYKT